MKNHIKSIKFEDVYARIHLRIPGVGFSIPENVELLLDRNCFRKGYNALSSGVRYMLNIQYTIVK